MTGTNDDAEQDQPEQQAPNLRAMWREMAQIENRVRDEERAQAEAERARADDAVPAESVLTEVQRAQTEERARAESQTLMEWVERYRRDVVGRTEEELIAEAPRSPQIRQPLELTKRLIDSNRNLQSELAKSRESSERIASTLSGQMTRLTDELINFRKSSDNLAGRVVWWSRALAALTAALLAGTAVLIWLTIVLVQRTPPNPTESTPSPTHTSTPSHPASRAARPTPTRSP